MKDKYVQMSERRDTLQLRRRTKQLLGPAEKRTERKTKIKAVYVDKRLTALFRPVSYSLADVKDKIFIDMVEMIQCNQTMQYNK